jgi:hypothetical protein
MLRGRIQKASRSTTSGLEDSRILEPGTLQLSQKGHYHTC